MGDVTTQVVAVTVYPDRARVTRRGQVRAVAGGQTLEVNGLPLGLNVDSVRASARSSTAVRLLGVQLEQAFFAAPQVEQVFQLEEALEKAQAELRHIDSQIELLKNQRQAVSGLMGQSETFALALASGELSLEGHAALLQGLRAQGDELVVELQTLEARRRAQEREIQKIRSELENWRGVQGRQQYIAKVEIEAAGEGDLELDLSYVVSGAGWQALYDFRLLEAAEPPVLEVGYLAQMTQRTGEDWNEVEITLSTARPAQSGSLPDLSPWYVQPAPPPPPPMEFRSLAAAPMPAPKMARMEQEESGALWDAEPVTASVEDSGATVTYKLPARLSVPSDGTPHKATIARFNLQPRLDYLSAPRLTESVYRRATVVNSSPYSLLPGSMSLFVDEEFIGSAYLKLTVPEEELELPLGVEDRIKVERELKRREVDRRLIGNRRRIVYGYEIRLQNLTHSRVDLTLQDSIPVGRHEEIRVRLEAAEPRPTQQTELNRLEWEFSLEPRMEQIVRFDFSVEHPANMQVMGLP